MRMCTKRIMGHELLSDLFRKRRIKAATNINRHQFSLFPSKVRFKFGALLIECRLFGICLRMNGDVFSSSHRHGARNQTGDPRNQYAAVRCM